MFIKRRLPLILLILILLLSAFLRLYRISDYMTFLGDEGRDVLVAKGILEGHFTLLGPRASAADFYLGPIYYYMIAPFLGLFLFDPVGPAVMVAIFGIATVYLVYFVGKKFFNTKAGLFAAALYAVSPLVITYSHSSWNPNVLPFFSLLVVYLVYVAITVVKPWKYYLIAGILLGIALQLHYLALFLITIVAVYMLIAAWIIDKKIEIRKIAMHYLYLLGGFLIGFSPFILFELRHNFPNTRTIINFVFVNNLPKPYSGQGTFLTTVSDVFFRVFARLVFDFPQNAKQISGNDIQIWAGLVLFTAVIAIAASFYKTAKHISLLLGLWLFLGVILFGFYKLGIYDYYFAFLFPLPFLLMGNLLSKIYGWNTNNIRRILGVTVALVLFFALFLLNLWDMPFRHPANRQKDQVKQIAQFIVDNTGNKPYNFALLSGGNSDHAYRYYLEILGKKPVVLENIEKDPQRNTVTEQLIVVCENSDCKPLGNPLWEVAGFGRAAIVNDWDVSVVKVFKLIHYTERNTAE